jgi:hypothetical protein
MMPMSTGFSMSAIEAVRVLLRLKAHFPEASTQELPILARKWGRDATTLDYERAMLLLPQFSDSTSNYDTHSFYIECVERIILSQKPPWWRLITLGRERFVEMLARDEAQCFRAAGLLVSPPTQVIIDWWDRMSALARSESDALRAQQGRRAELLTLDYETTRLLKLGILQRPMLVALEDNLAGYDVLSYDVVGGLVSPRLIEVKSTKVKPIKFFLSRSEWNEAQKRIGGYFFYIWYLGSSPPELFIRTVTQVSESVPTDRGSGAWQNVVITVPDIQVSTAPCTGSLN